METWAWLATLVVLLVQLGRGGTDYVWDGEEFVWQDLAEGGTEEGSGGGGVVATGQ